MRKQCRSYLFASTLLSVLLLAASAYAQFVPSEATDSNLGGSYLVQGTVLGPTGQRLKRRVLVRLVTETRGQRTANTDERGNFSFRGLTPGGYSIVIDKEEDFAPYMTSFDIFRGSPSQTIMLSIRLSGKAVEVPKAVVVDAAFAGVPEDALEHYRKGEELSAAGDLRAAADEFKEATDRYSKFSMAFNQLGVQFLRLGQIEDADAAFASALEIDPESFEALTNRGIALVQLKKFPDAVPPLRKSLEHDPDSAVAHYFLGQALANLGEFEEGSKELTSALELGGDQMNEARRILAIIYASRGENKRAASALESYLKVNPKAADAVELRGTIKKLKTGNR